MALSRTQISALIDKVRRGISPLEFTFIPHPRWPLPRAIRPQPHVNISILDSSFNPPTIAHLGLANYPRREPDGHAYDAKIFLLSVRNADKQLKPTDATYEQRLEMMYHLAQSTVRKGHRHTVAVGVIDEPTFIGKAKTLQTWIQQHFAPFGADPPRAELTFLVGFDTLERIFAPRYYGDTPDDPEAENKMFAALETFFSPEHDNARIICARRTPPLSPYKKELPASKEEEDLLTLADRFVQTNRLRVVDLDSGLLNISSTSIREGIGRGRGWYDFVPKEVREYIYQEALYGYTKPMR
ncbi:hypothetical protein MKEN_00342800 [Mycena kentingensis (nom. inval.)]|nr:hypothetical protein MKEN_00342800 [Mycena kentingensis (nom. inval.)]